MGVILEETTSLKIALKSSDLIVKQYARSMVSQNAKLKTKIGKLEAQNIGQKHEIVALRKQLKKLPSLPVPVFHLHPVLAKDGRPA